MIDHIYFGLFNKSGIKKQIQIQHPGGTLVNKDIYFEQFSLTESLFSGTNLTFGNCEAASVKFRIANTIDPLVGQSLTILNVLNEDENNSFSVGSYKCFSDTPTADRKYRDVVAYDAMYDIINANVTDWYNSRLFPMPLREFRSQFAAHFGLTENPDTLVNDELIVERTINANEISGKTILTAICEINGCFGHINRSGKLEYVRLKKRGAVEIDKYKAPLKYENYVIAPITKVQVRQEEGDLGGSYGSGNNCYVVQGNFLAFGKSESDLVTIAQNVLSEIGGITYRPSSVSTIGNPCIEVGDTITVHTSDMDVVSIVTSRTISGIQALKDTYTSSGQEKQLQQLNTTKEELLRLKAKANILTRTLEETKSEITRLETYVDDNYSTSEEVSGLIKQSADNVLIEVKGTYTTKGEVSSLVEDLQDQIDGNIQTWTGVDNPTLSNYPANQWTDTETKNQHIGDLYYVESEGSSSGFCYRFQQNNGVYEWVLLKDSEVTKALKDAADALSGLGELEMDLSANYSTTKEMLSAIEATEEAVEISVSQKIQAAVGSSNQYTKDMLAALKLGGRNLIRDSRSLAGFYAWTNTSGSLVSYEPELDEFALGYYPSKDSAFTDEIFDYGGYHGQDEKYVIDIEKIRGYDLVFSFEVKGSEEWTDSIGELKINFSLRADSTNSYVNSRRIPVDDLITSEWKRVEVTTDFLKANLDDFDALNSTGRLVISLFNNSPLGFMFRKPKLELGTKSTDWTPAPEDVEEEIAETDATLRQYVATEKTSILTAAEGIYLNALKEYVLSTAFDNLKTYTESQLSLLSDQLNLKFTQSTEKTDKVNTDLQGMVDTLTKWFTFEVDGLTISQSNSPFKVVIDNDQFSMFVNDVEFLWLKPNEADGSNIPRLKVTEKLNLFGYQMTEDSEGRVNEVYVGY